jgi:hypothetical protein
MIGRDQFLYIITAMVVCERSMDRSFSSPRTARCGGSGCSGISSKTGWEGESMPYIMKQALHNEEYFVMMSPGIFHGL